MRSLPKTVGFIAICVALSCAVGPKYFNVVLIGVDTVRPDHMGCYGYDRKTTPAIDKLASQGVLFENVVSQSPWTLPSFATILTSLYPTQHGAVSSRTSLGKNFPTMATILKENGYATGAIINAPFLKKRYGLKRDFDEYQMPEKPGRIADGTTVDALEWIDLNMEQPFFIFVHYFDPHLPYSPPPPYDTLFYPGYKGTIRNSYNPKYLSRARANDFEKFKSLTPDDWRHITALYDGEIAFTDEAVGDLIKGLEDRDLLGNTLIILLSDHGEEFFEHGGFEHGHTLFDELIRAPLIFSLPGLIPKNVRLSKQVRLLDVAPTTFDLLDIKPEAHFEGVSLRPLFLKRNSHVKGSDAMLLPPEVAYSEANLYYHEKKSVTAYPWKLIYDTKSGDEAFYNLADDPQEKQDIVGRVNPSLPLLESTLIKTLFSISNTWYVEMVGGDREHIFDVDLRCEGHGRSATFGIYTMLDADQNIVDRFELSASSPSASNIKLQSVRIKEPLTLAFKVNDEKTALRFDLKIDGRPATHRTYVGKSLVKPVTMPFIEKDARDENTDEGKPDRRPDAPYILVWCSPGGCAEDTYIELDKETENELRALGYIQ